MIGPRVAGLGDEDEAFEDTNPGGNITAIGASAAACEAFIATYLVPEFGIYPDQLVRDVVALFRIVLVDKLAYNGQWRSALPDYLHFTLYLSVAPHDAAYVRKVIHHEWFHMVDFAEFGNDHIVDPEWHACLLAPDVYSPHGGEGMRGGTAGIWDLDIDPVPSTRNPGFVTAYASSAAIEDKAEVWAALVCFRPASLDALLGSDPVLASKAALLRARVAGLTPTMGPAWFAALGALRERAFDEDGRHWQPVPNRPPNTPPYFVHALTRAKTYNPPL
ncbi:uncharacterized protein AMSG_08744 [Thecamonas trahens ATCC 50062]|uniref:Uncharacterized protein n=1 Tax=Thecamonas trahens ATCC 50062 TaxID=461836 RepID=A0A0L0DMK5_THETB|nr:hypothetical protein AMSG_08744 [Thecamonas trahens ATCC 50062]KNC53256.1 hypothetical protein AMSG_08744 [Thecamonas trahens ATCC 50062]|eukprot:XP_013754520.1 hypothetical protein AMSG_08744 [Thecamonas trahens ATCC 50062]